MFSPKRSSDKKVDKKAIKEKYRRMSESRDNNIKLNILGIPKEQVTVQKTHQDSKNEDLFKIYIDTRNKRRNKSTSSDDSNAGNEKFVPAKKGRRNNDVCLNLPGETKRDVKIIQRPSEATIRDSPKQQFMQYNVQAESTRNKLFQRSKETANERQTGHDQFLSPSDDNIVSSKSVKKDKPGKRWVIKRGSKQVEFADYDAVYGTGSEQSSDDSLPFDKKSPIVFRVGDDMQKALFAQSASKNDPTTAGTGKKDTAQSVGPNNAAMDPSKRAADLEVPLNQSVPKESTTLNTDGKINPQSDRVPKEQPPSKDKIEHSSLNVIGVPNLEARLKNVTKPMTADSATMTDSPSGINEGNAPNVGSGIPKKPPLSRDPSSESSGRYRSPDGSKSKKDLVSTIPKPDFNALRRDKGPQSSKGLEKGTELTSKTSRGAGKDDGDGPGDEKFGSAAPKTPRKLTPVNVNKRYFKPIFFPPETNDLREQYMPPPQHPENLSDGQLHHERSNVDPTKKRFSIDSDKNVSGGNAQTIDDTRAPKSKVGNDRSRSVSIVLNGSRINELEPANKSANQKDNTYSPVLDGYADLTADQSPTRVPAREQVKNAVPVDEHVDKDTVKRRYNSPSPSRLDKMFSPSQESPRGKRSESSNKSSGSKRDIIYEGSVGTSEEIASNTYPSNVVSVDMRTKQSSAYPMNQKPSNVIQILADLLDDGGLTDSNEASPQQEKSSSTIKPTHKPSLHDITNPNEEIDKPHGENKQTDSVLSEINPKDYINLRSTGAVPRTARSVKSTQGPSKSGQSWANVGEKLSKRGTPSVGTIKEEGTDPETETHQPPNLKDNSNRPSAESRLTLDISGAQYLSGGGNKNIDKDRTNIFAYPGHLTDGTPFAYSPTGADAYQLENTHPDYAGDDQPSPVDETQLQTSTKPRDEAARGRPGRKSKTVKRKPAPGGARKQSKITQNGARGPDAGAFGLRPDQKLVYLGKIPDTTYNVFYSPDDKTSKSTESKTTVLNTNREKLVWEMPKGILIFVNKKNDHACPFKNGNRDLTAVDGDGKTNGRDDLGSGTLRGVGQRPRRASLDKNVTVEQTPAGKNVREEYPCGCYRVTTFDKADELQHEAFVSAGCKDGSLCEVAHPELAPSPEGSYAVDVYRPEGKPARRPSPGYGSSKKFPGIEVIAEGVVSKNKIKPRPPAEKMRGAGLFASLDVKSDRLNGIFNFYLDPRLKRYLRENLPAMLEDGDKTRR